MPKRPHSDDSMGEIERKFKKANMSSSTSTSNQTSAFEKLFKGSKDYYKKLEGSKNNGKKCKPDTHICTDGFPCTGCSMEVCNVCQLTCYGCAYYFCKCCVFAEQGLTCDTWKCITCKWFR